jgi:hypothetical protein
MTCRITPSVTLESKEPGFSALLSLVFVGLGQAYNGQFLRGVLFLVGTLNGGTVPYRESSVAAVLLFLVVWLVGLLFLPVAPAAVSTLTSGLSWW